MMNRKTYPLLLAFLLASAGVFSQSQTENFIRVRTFLSADSSTWRDKTVYYDDMGREEQTVQAGASTSGGDIVTLKEYDGYGRLEKEWNPAAVSSNSGYYTDSTTLKTLAVQSNCGDGEPYSLNVYEPSPLNRTEKQFGAGSDCESVTMCRAVFLAAFHYGEVQLHPDYLSLLGFHHESLSFVIYDGH